MNINSWWLPHIIRPFFIYDPLKISSQIHVYNYMDAFFLAMRGWDLSDAVLEVKAPEASERNFMALNKAALHRGLVTAPEHTHFRSLNDIRKSLTKQVVPRCRKQNIPANATFGVFPR